MTTKETTKRTPSATTLKVRAYGRMERLNADIKRMQDDEAARREKYEERLREKMAERDAAEGEHRQFLQAEIDAAKLPVGPAPKRLRLTDEDAKS